MTVVGDSHNFGQSVRRVKSPDSSFWYEKPRPIYWERLFFGIDSSIKSFFSHQEILFGLHIEESYNNFLGRSKEIIAFTGPTTNHHFFGFGYLLGYAYALGIQDLFFENVIKTENGLLPIDVEIVLSKFILPQESFLLPFKNRPYEKIGISHLIPDIEKISVDNVEMIVDGFCAVIKDFDTNCAEIIKAIQSDQRAIAAPIRVLLRKTSDYRDWRDKNYTEQPLLPEEIEQLKRCDVPYFFKFMGSDDLFYFEKNKQQQKVFLPESLQKGVQEIGVNISNLLTTTRIRQELFPRGVLFLLKKLLTTDWTGNFQSSHIAVKLTLNQIEIKSRWGEFLTRR